MSNKNKCYYLWFLNFSILKYFPQLIYHIVIIIIPYDSKSNIFSTIECKQCSYILLQSIFISGLSVLWWNKRKYYASENWKKIKFPFYTFATFVYIFIFYLHSAVKKSENEHCCLFRYRRVGLDRISTIKIYYCYIITKHFFIYVVHEKR